MVLPNIASYVEEFVGVEQRLSDFIAGPTPSNPVGAAIQASARRTCDRVSASPSLQFLGRQSFASINRQCQQYWDDNNYSAPEELPPFTGGQCPGDRYSVELVYTLTRRDGSTFQGAPDDSPVLGPLRLFEQRNPLPDGKTEVRFRLTNVNTPTQDGAAFGFQLGARDSGPLPSDFVSFSIDAVNIENLDNPADDCGDPPPQLEPGLNPAPDPGPEFEPTENPYGGPPEFPLPDVYVDITFGEQPLPPLPSPDDRGDVTPPATDTGDPPPDSGDSSADDPPDGEPGRPFVVGAVVTVTKPPEGNTSEYLQGSGPHLTIPRHGSLYFSLSLGEQGRVWSTPIPVQNRRVYIPVPEGGLACTAVFAPFRNSEATVTLIRIPTAEEAEENGSTC